MKKTIITLAALVCCTFGVFAQTDLVATLSHGSDLTTYFGADALSEAYETAVEGDIITLSSGTFNAVDIEKAIIVRGAGINLVGVEPTIIAGTTMTLRISDVASTTLTLEGITFTSKVYIEGKNLAPINLMKCRFSSLYVSGCTATCTHCLIDYCQQYGDNHVTVRGLESVIKRPDSLGPANDLYPRTGRFVLDNCIVLDTSERLYASTLNNCIIVVWSGTLPSSAVANNCIGFCKSNSSTSQFTDASGNNNITIDDITTIFKTLDSYDAKLNETFELTPTAAATYRGDDGTQVGIYGGSNPFDPTPSNPQVKKFTVNSTTDGGMLKVTINVE